MDRFVKSTRVDPSSQDTEIRVKYIASEDDVADELNKALFKLAFEELRKKMGLRELESELETGRS